VEPEGRRRPVGRVRPWRSRGGLGRVAMTSIERTAYPRFGRLVTARELLELGLTPDEVTWVRERTRSDEHLLALAVSLKCFQRLGHFPRQDEVPEVVVDHVRRSLGLSQATKLFLGSERTAKGQRELVRDYVGVVLGPEWARTVAAGAIRTAAEAKNNPPDLIILRSAGRAGPSGRIIGP